MVSAGTFCDEADVAMLVKNKSADIDNGDTAETDFYIVNAESVINCVCRYNFTDTYASLNGDVKEILRETAAKLAAIDCITYDMSGFTSRVEAEDMINVFRDTILRNLAILRDKKVQEFIHDG